MTYPFFSDQLGLRRRRYISADFLDDAACRGMSTELFFPITPNLTPETISTLRVCQHCPVRLRCLEWAIGNHEVDGIYGGVRAKTRVNGAKRGRTPEMIMARADAELPSRNPVSEFLSVPRRRSLLLPDVEGSYIVRERKDRGGGKTVHKTECHVYKPKDHPIWGWAGVRSPFDLARAMKEEGMLSDYRPGQCCFGTREWEDFLV